MDLYELGEPMRRIREAIELELLAASLTASPIATLILDERGQVSWANDEAAVLGRRSAVEMVGLPVGEAVCCVQAFSVCGASSACRGCLLRVLVDETRASGKRARMVDLSRPFERTSVLDSPRVFASTARVMVGGRARVVLALQTSSASAGPIDDSPDLVTVTNALAEALFTVRLPDRRIEYVNHAAEELFGRSAREMVGQPTVMLYPSEAGARAFGAKLTAALASGEPKLRTEHEFARGDGEPFWGAVSTTFLYEGSQVTRVISVVTDITERRRLEREKARIAQSLSERQRLDSLGLLAGGIAHDFNNILTAVTVNADLLRTSLAPSSSEQQILAAISDAAKRAAELTHQLLAYAGQGRVSVEHVDLTELVRGMSQLLGLSISSKAELELELEPVAAVEADATQLRQVIMNLVINASQALVDGRGIVRVRLREQLYEDAAELAVFLPRRLPSGRYAVIEVEDEGCGIDETDLAHIFDPFFTTKHEGHGLGLSAILGIVNAHRGGIQVDSVVGEGTRFRVLLPVVAGEVRRAEPSSSYSEDWQGSGRALVVDDDPVLRLAAQQMLEYLGYEVEQACDGAEAVECVRTAEESFAFILLDLTMPVMDGIEALEHVREHDPEVPVILVSGSSKLALSERHELEGFTSFMHKPYDLLELQTVLGELG